MEFGLILLAGEGTTLMSIGERINSKLIANCPIVRKHDNATRGRARTRRYTRSARVGYRETFLASLPPRKKRPVIGSCLRCGYRSPGRRSKAMKIQQRRLVGRLRFYRFSSQVQKAAPWKTSALHAMKKKGIAGYPTIPSKSWRL